jgi:hypothetical protein
LYTSTNKQHRTQHVDFFVEKKKFVAVSFFLANQSLFGNQKMMSLFLISFVALLAFIKCSDLVPSLPVTRA